MSPDYPVIEFAQVVRGGVLGRSSAEEITIFDSVGFALEDYSALRFVRGQLDDHARRREIDLIPLIENPKDLFGGTLGTTLAKTRERRIA